MRRENIPENNASVQQTTAQHTQTHLTKIQNQAAKVYTVQELSGLALNELQWFDRGNSVHTLACTRARM